MSTHPSEYSSFSQIHRAIVQYSSTATGEIQVIIPSVTGNETTVPISFFGRKAHPFENDWVVPNIGDTIIVCREDEDYTNTFWINTTYNPVRADVGEANPSNYNFGPNGSESIFDLSDWAGHPTSAGLYLGSIYMGFHTGSNGSDGWRTYMDYTGKFYLKGSGTNTLTWDGSTLAVTGTVTATDGEIGGWTIDADSMFSGTKDTSGYADGGGITISSGGSIHAKQFYIDTSGNAFFKGDLTGANITGTTGTFTGNITGASGTFDGTVDAATLSGNTITGGTININNAFQVNGSGALTATNATITGDITANSGTFTGTVSGSTINGGTINVPQSSPKFSVNGSGVLTAVDGIFTGAIQSGSTISGAAITAGTINVPAISPKFSVDANGILTAVDGNFSGSITGSTLTIGTNAWHVDVNGNMWWGNHANIGAASIKISSAGAATLTGAAISGSITGSTIDIGSNSEFTVDSDGQVEFGLNSKTKLRVKPTASNYVFSDSTALEFVRGSTVYGFVQSDSQSISLFGNTTTVGGIIVGSGANFVGAFDTQPADYGVILNATESGVDKMALHAGAGVYVTQGKLSIQNTSAPSPTANWLYAVSGQLFWNNIRLDTSGGTTYTFSSPLSESSGTVSIDLSTYMQYWELKADDSTYSQIGPGNERVHIVGGTDIDTSISGNYLTINHETGNGNYHVPAGGSSGQFLKYSSAGQAAWAADNDTVYTHPTSAGNKHIPSGGSTNQFLKYSSSGTATWAAAPADATKLPLTGGTLSGDLTLTGYRNVSATNSLYLRTNTSTTNITCYGGGSTKLHAGGYDVLLAAQNTITTYVSGEPVTDYNYTWGSSNKKYSAMYAGAFTTTSDINSKTDIQDATLGLSFVNALRPVTFKWKSMGDEHTSEMRAGVRNHQGFIAQEVETLLGDAAASTGLWINGYMPAREATDDGLEAEPESYNPGLRYDQFIPVLTKALQEISTKLDAAEARIATLESA